MSRFAIRTPYFIIVVCLFIAVIGVTSLVRMPVDLFPNINIPVVVVATFYTGMPPEQIESDITGRFERFFTLGSGIEHIESRSLPGVSLIKVYFQPGSDSDAAVTTISNLAMADLRRLPPGTLPPVVLKFDASSLPVCLVTVKGEGMSEAALRDNAQYTVRNQIASVPGASVPQPFGGKYRQIMIYVDPLKMEARQLSAMDVVRSVNDANLILPAGDVKIGPLDYSIYTNSQLDTMDDINELPIKTVGQAMVRVRDIGEAKDAQQIQLNVVRVDGQNSVYLPILKQGGDTNTIAVVDGTKDAVKNLTGIPKELKANVVFDQSIFVKSAIETLLHEGAIGVFLTSLMILIFLGSMRATVAVCLSIPLSALATFIVLYIGGSSVNTMILGGLALAFSRLIDNSVVVIENIFRHLELGESPEVAAEKGGREVALPVLAATLTTVVVFFPVTLLYGVSKFLFTSLALAVVISLFASYAVAMTVVPLFCAKLIKGHHGGHQPGEAHTSAEAEERAEESEEFDRRPRRNRRFSFGARFNAWFNRRFDGLLGYYDRLLGVALNRPISTIGALLGVFAVSLLIYPLLGLAFFPRTEAGQFLINIKAQSGTRLELTQQEVLKVENLIREIVAPEDLGMIVSNIGVQPGFSSIYTSNSAPHTAFVQVSLKEGAKIGSYEYMNRARRRIASELPDLSAYFQSGGIVDAVLNMGLPAPIDVQVSGQNLERNYVVASQIAAEARKLPGVSDVYIPQDLDYPALNIDVDRTRSGQLGLSTREVVSNIITSLISNQMIAPSYWVDPKNGNDYMLTVQYPEGHVQSLADLKSIPVRAQGRTLPTTLDAVTRIERGQAPTEVDHYQIRRVIDVYVSTAGEDLGRVANAIDGIVAGTQIPEGVRVDLRGMAQGMRSSFKSFGVGLLLSTLLVYLILVAQFRSFIDPFLILLAVPMGLIGVLLTLWLSGTTLNVQSLMGVVMLVGIATSNSILIVDFTRNLIDEGSSVREAVAQACRVRLRPILMTSLATIIGLLPMALKLGTGSEAYAPLARAIIGGLFVSVILTVFIVPAAYMLVYSRRGRMTTHVN
ncbi:MAG TPA: efflux RND transporter permease subunit [Blastocatellia bacterium]|jgi:multidrug efflux pump subunit AcrB